MLYNTNNPHKYHAKYTKSDIKDHTLFDSICMKYSGSGTPRQNADWWLLGAGGKGECSYLMEMGFLYGDENFRNMIEVVIIYYNIMNILNTCVFNIMLLTM